MSGDDPVNRSPAQLAQGPAKVVPQRCPKVSCRRSRETSNLRPAQPQSHGAGRVNLWLARGSGASSRRYIMPSVTTQQVVDYLKANPDIAKKAMDYVKSHPGDLKNALKEAASERGWDLSQLDTA